MADALATPNLDTPYDQKIEQCPANIHEPGTNAGHRKTDPSNISKQPATVPPSNGDPDQSPKETPPGDNEKSRRSLNVFGRVWPSLPTDRWQALFNTLLIIVGFLQWKVYRKQADIMAIQARSAANAVDVEQPYLFVTRIDKVEFTYSHDWMDGNSYHKPSTKAYVINLGRTPAVLSMSKIGIIFDYFPSNKPDSFLEHTGFHQDIIIVDRHDEHGIRVEGSSFESSMLKSDYFRERTAIVYGTLVYYDMFNNRIETTFGFSAKGLDEDFKRINSRWYNHRRVFPRDSKGAMGDPPDTFGL